MSIFFDQRPSSSWSWYLGVIEVLLIVVQFPNMLREILDHGHAEYSKFSNDKGAEVSIDSRKAMTIIYSPATLLAVAFASLKLFCALVPVAADAFGTLGAMIGLALEQWPSDRLWLFTAAIFIHFVKRLLEVQFVHQYSGKVTRSVYTAISFHYSLVVFNLLLAQQLSEGMAPPTPNLTYMGVLVFLVGIAGNFYHHKLLAGLRKEGSKKYEIPHGGLFGYVVCPHYLFEILGFAGLALIGQTVFSAVTVVSVLLYLTGRSIATKNWYLQKVDGFPRNRCALVPFFL